MQTKATRFQLPQLETKMLAFTAFAVFVAVVAALPSPLSTSSSLTARQSLPNSFKWTSTGPLIYPKNDTRKIAGIKDPSIVEIDGVYHVFASTAVSEGYNLVYFNFTDFNAANNAPFYYLDQAPLGTGYRAAPQFFYFEPQKLWYLVYQNGNAAYSTNADISDPSKWTAPKTFYDRTPPLIEEGLPGGYWVDMWVICDDENCHLFSHDDNGRLYRSQTPVPDFPNGMSEPVIAMQDNKNDLFEAANVYKTGEKQYLLLVECIGSVGRYFRSWTSSDIAGPWQALAATESNPFMGASNVEFNGTVWTKSISHGEIIRTEVNQYLKIKPCDMRFLYQGVDPSAGGDYNSLPWRLGVLTQQGLTC